MIEPLDITWLEQAWQEYKNSKNDNIGCQGLLVLLGEHAGDMLQEIRVLRTQVGGLQAKLNDTETELQNAYDYYDP